MQDGLTGLANRRQLDVTLGKAFSRAARTGSELAFIMLDVDCFKQYNDLYGHSAGDDCLRAISKAIRAQTPKPPGDLAARHGGEEVGELLPETGVAGAQAVAERIRKAIEELRIAHAGSPGGFACWPPAWTDPTAWQKGRTVASTSARPAPCGARRWAKPCSGRT